jgi:DNA polymerase I
MKKSSPKSSKKKLSSFIADEDINNSKSMKKPNSVIPTKRLKENHDSLSEDASEKKSIESKKELSQSTFNKKEINSKNKSEMKSSVEIVEKGKFKPKEDEKIKKANEYESRVLKSDNNKNSHFLLSVRYNGFKNKAEMVFYDQNDHKLLYLEDHTNHKPYFVVKKSVNEIKDFILSKKNQENDFEKIVEVQGVILEDRLTFTKDERAKVVVKTPSDVPPVRSIFRSSGIETYESEIRYHLNWIFDTKIIPGLNYSTTEQEINLLQSMRNEIPVNEKESEILKNFKDNKIFSSLIPNFLPIFTEMIPTNELLLASLDIEVENPPKQFPRAESARYPVSCISIYTNKEKSYVLILNKDNEELSNQNYKLPESTVVEHFTSEKELLIHLNTIINKFPIIFTFNGDEFDIQYLSNRMKNKKIPNSKFKYNGRSRTGIIDNCLQLDLFKWFNNPAIKTYAYSGKYKRSSLKEVVLGLTKNQKIEIEGEITDLSISELMFYCWNDAKITLDLVSEDNYLTWKLMILLCRICHIPIDELINKRVSSWLMYFLYYEHRIRDFLIPNNREIALVKGINAQSAAMSKDKKFQGAEVLEPKPGFHFDVTVLDFASLYPSIIHSRNLSYETINCGHSECKQNLISGTSYYSCVKEIGIFSLLLGFLKEIRVKWFKVLAKDKNHPFSSFYSVVEKSLKVLINAAYGVLGAEFFAFYCLAAAEATTSVGRFAIQKTVEKCEEMNIDVLYGDTDSVFVRTTTKEQIEELIDWSDENLGISLEIDKIYKFVALSNRKKNYIGLLDNGNLDIKGLMGKKSNTPTFIQEAFNKVGLILQGIEKQEDFDDSKLNIEKVVKECYSKLERSKRLDEQPDGYTASELAFTIQMTKATSAYSSKVQHVEAAKKLEQFRKNQGNLNYEIQPGMFIQYLKGVNEPLPLELVEKGLIIDIEAYKNHVHTTFSQILEFLGIDIESLRRKKVDLRKFF